MFFACGIWCLADVSSVSPSSEQTVRIVSRKQLKVLIWRPLKPTFGEIFLFQNLVLYMRYHNNFSADLKL